MISELVPAPAIPVAIGFRPHSGWAALVAVGGDSSDPKVVDRRRIELTDPGQPEGKAPYHAAAKMGIEHAPALIERCRMTAGEMAHRALEQVIGDLARSGHRVVGASLLLGSGRLPGSLAAILASHALVHAADGEHFREAIRYACESHGLTIGGVRDRDLMGQTAEALGVEPDDLEQRVNGWGRRLGPPWAQDQKAAAVAAWLVLAGAGSGAGGARSTGTEDVRRR